MKKKNKSNDGKMWVTVQEQDAGYVVYVGRTRDGANEGHFMIDPLRNDLSGTGHTRGYIKEIRRNGSIMFADHKAKKTRTIEIKTNSEGLIGDPLFLEC